MLRLAARYADILPAPITDPVADDPRTGVMASGGVNTPGTDVMLTQFSTAELQLIVDRAHAAGVAVTAHAHRTPAVEQAVAAGVDGIEHCSCVTDRGVGQVSEETVAALARSRIAVCPTIGVDPELMVGPAAGHKSDDGPDGGDGRADAAGPVGLRGPAAPGWGAPRVRG